MLRWFDSPAVFWPFMLGVAVMGDIWAATMIVNNGSKGVGELTSGLLVTAMMFWFCRNAYRNQR